jgi:hypothetical protein
MLYQAMKTKLPLILLVIGLAGCQQKSEVDKCVEALLLHACRNAPDLGKEDPQYPKWNSNTCKESMGLELGSNYRLQCMKAQAGG